MEKQTGWHSQRLIEYRIFMIETRELLSTDRWLWNYDDLYVSDLQEILNREECVFSQRTGLYDKNWTKIFEGDILMSHGRKWHIIFEGWRFYPKSNIDYLQRMMELDLEEWYCEVTWNIYQNIDLLSE